MFDISQMSDDEVRQRLCEVESILAEYQERSTKTRALTDEELIDLMLDELTYDHRTGVFRWKWSSKKPRGWNTRWAGKKAGCRNELGYITLTVRGTAYQAHVLAVLWMTRKRPPPGFVVDHVNGNRADNSWDSLRVCEKHENAANTKLKKNNTSGHRGVNLHHGKYQAKIKFRGQYIHGGTYTTLEEAVFAYNILQDAWHGDFARTT